MANVSWLMRLYNVDGGGISAANMNVVAPATSNVIEHATNRELDFPLNGVDSCGFSLYLDDPMAFQVRRLSTVVKVWRTVRNDGGSVIYSDSNPCFAGTVGFTRKEGDANMMHVRAFSPIWRLQFRFHLLNHYLKTNIETGDPYTQSELMWKLIELVNEAFGIEDSNTGIAKGTFTSGNDPVMGPYFVPKGSNTYTNIFDEIMRHPSGVDIVPTYIDDGGPTLMNFNTAEKRGNEGSASFEFHTSAPSNLSDLVEEIQIAPDEFANYYWAVGAGGPNSGKIAMEENIDGADGYESIGIYMKRQNFEDIKKIGVRLPVPTHLRQVAMAEFAEIQFPRSTYEATISPAGGLYYGENIGVGDTVNINASKNALQVSGVTQRIYNANLTMSDNNIETCAVQMSEDFTEAVPE